MAINWAQLHDKERGSCAKDNKGIDFETLALLYLENTFEGKWKQTGQTRDGNKDAISIVFNGGKRFEEWAEAKYTSKKKLSRYKLDATIVSATIRKGEVTKLICITNSIIAPTTQNNIRCALSNAMGNKFEVHFRTKEDIEFWLCNNPKIYDRFFDGTEQDLLESQKQFSTIRVLGNINIYKQNKHLFSFNESLNRLYENKTYTLSFDIFSPKEIKALQLKILDKKIKLVSTKEQINVKEGNNSICFDIKCVDVGSVNRELVSLEYEEWQEYVSIGNSSIEIEHSIKLYISSQEEAFHNIVAAYDKFNTGLTGNQCHLILGNGAVGKTVLIENLLNSGIFENIDVIYQSFSSSAKDDQLLLVNVILSIIFHYLPDDAIDHDYLEKLTNQLENTSEYKSFVPSYLTELVKAKTKDSTDELVKVMMSYSLSEELFSSLMNLNNKVIILDDVHKLDDVSRRFLTFLLQDIVTSKFNSFIILSGRHEFSKHNEFQNFIKTGYTLHKLEFSNKDVIDSLTKSEIQIPNDSFQQSYFYAPKGGINAILITHLIKYIKSRPEFINSSSDTKRIIIGSFLNDPYTLSDILQNIFSEVSKKNREQADLLNIIYFSAFGIAVTDFKKKYSIIVKEHLSQHVKVNENNVFIPIHDFYQEVYVGHHKPIELYKIKEYLEREVPEYIFLRDSLVFYEYDENKTAYVLDQIVILIKNHQFHTVSYILDSIFGVYAQQMQLDNNFTKPVYFKLKYMYFYSIVNCRSNVSGMECFTSLHGELKKFYSESNSYDDEEKVCRIYLSVIGELVNSHFEHLSFSVVDQLIEEYNCVLNKSIKEGYIQSKATHKPGFLLTKGISFLTDLAKDNFENVNKKYDDLNTLYIENDDINRIDILRIRYARSIVHKDRYSALEYLNLAVQSLSSRKSGEYKWLLLGDFERKFINFQNSESPSMRAIRKSHEKLKENFTNDYRKASLVIAACYLMLGDDEMTYKYLHQDFFIKRKMRPRLEGMRLHLLALYEYYFNKKVSDALGYLERQKLLFSELGNSYHAVIEHNTKLISSSIPKVYSINFFQEGNNNDTSLLIDPRLW